MRFTVSNEESGKIEATTLHEEGPFEYGNAIEVTYDDHHSRILYPIDTENLEEDNALYGIYAEVFEVLNELDQLRDKYEKACNRVTEIDKGEEKAPQTGTAYARVRKARSQF